MKFEVACVLTSTLQVQADLSGDVVEYCPDPARDFQEEVEAGSSGVVTWTDDGWSTQGQRRVSSKFSIDLSGGGAWWHMDLSKSQNGVNNNFYVTYPYGNRGIIDYCDSCGNHDSQGRGCAEMDWTENNGNCYSATTAHDDPAGSSDCGGHGDHTNLNPGINSYSAVYSADGSSLDITVNGHTMKGSAHTDSMKSRGAVLYSSQWVGWVPGDFCGGGGNLGASIYAVENLRVTGKILSGPEPRRCGAGPSPTPTPPVPTPPPTPTPTPTPSGEGQCCYGGCAIAPTSCNPAGEYCSSVATCGQCGGTWCGGDTPPAPTPTPPAPTPSPKPAGAYCLAAGDLVTAYGSPQLKDGGWDIHGNGGAASRASFNLLGGYVEFDVDVSNVKTGVNANLYAIAPSNLGPGGFTDNDKQYCDGAINDRPNCIELDWVEQNGNCEGAATLHTVMGTGTSAPCNSWGCRTSWADGKGKYTLRIDYDQSGRQTLKKDGMTFSDWSPAPIQQDWDIIKGEMQSKGVVIYGSEWTGWVPSAHGCSDVDGDLAGSSYSISNIVVQGSVVQGPTPRMCGGDMNTTEVLI